jgi:polyisoprenyl-teichoic acid--peptidoglycan teichoic acid transferase
MLKTACTCQPFQILCYNLGDMNQKVEPPFERQTSSAAVPMSRMFNLFLGLYAVIVLSVAAVAGFWLHDWARDRILGSSPLAANPWTHRTPQNAGASNAVPAEAAAVEAASDQSTQSVPAVPPINVLLMGTDTRTGELGPPRTDTLILLTLDRQSGSAGMLSLPRDLWVPIPSYNMTYKLNTAYAIGEERGYAGGGSQLVKDTVSGFLGQPVPYYVRINFGGFIELIDLIGGVDLEVPKTIYDEAYPTADYGVETFYLEAGWQHLDGETALKYVRTRNVDDDYGRAARQQALMKAVLNKVMSADMIPFLLSKLPVLVTTMRNSIQTDMPLATQLELANYIHQASLKEVRQLVLDNRFGQETYSAEGAWILLPDREKVRTAVEEFFRPATSSAQSGGVVAVSDPSAVRIEVLNGTDQPGVAAATRDLLEAQGLHVVSIGDADRDDYGRTLVINYGAPPQVVDKVAAVLKLQPSAPSLSICGLSWGLTC